MSVTFNYILFKSSNVLLLIFMAFLWWNRYECTSHVQATTHVFWYRTMTAVFYYPIVLYCYVFGLSICLPYTDLFGLPCSSFYLDPLIQAFTVLNVLSHHDLGSHCTIWSDSSSSVQYNLLWVQLSLVDAYRPLHSFTYISIYDKEYINCTIRILRP